MKTILFFIFLVVLIFTAESVLSMEFVELQKYDYNSLKVKLILILLCLAGIIITGKSIFRKYVR